MHKLLVALLAALLVSGCGLLYRQPIHQGNLIDKDQAEQLQAGMSKQQVLALLGTPAITDPFHAQRWDYTGTQRTTRVGRTEVRNLTLWFENDALARWDGEYFGDQDMELAAEMRKFGNLPREERQRRGGGGR